MKVSTPRAEGFRQPAEWAPHAACWLAWPFDAGLWGDTLEPAQASFMALCRAILDPDPATHRPRGEPVHLLLPDAAAEEAALRALGRLPVQPYRVPYGDIWVRDTAPIFVVDERGMTAAVRFGFNGWGGKYVLPHDDQVATRVAELSGRRVFRFDWVLEGGSIEPDGEGTLLTTRQCLLNPNRNPGMDQRAIEAGLREALGGEKVLWLGHGLLNDHTDGHVDTLARFVAPGVVACMAPAGTDDPNRDVLEQIARDLGGFTDARGRKLEVARIPSPGQVTDAEGRIMPASYANFYVANRTVVVPLYGVPNDERAVEAVAALFPGRRTVGVPAKAILGGGGAFHCITQQEPGGSLVQEGA